MTAVADVRRTAWQMHKGFHTSARPSCEFCQYDPRVAVLRQYERAYERHAVAEQVHRGVDDPASEEAHQNAVRVLKARMVEDEDPKVGPPQVMHCLTCAAAYAARGR